MINCRMKKTILIILVIIVSMLSAERDWGNIIPHKSGKYFIRISNQTKIDELGEYDWVDNIQKVGDKYLFHAKKLTDKGMKEFWVNAENGEVMYEMYDELQPLKLTLHGKSLFKARKDNKWFYADLETGKLLPGKYDRIGEIQKLGEREDGSERFILRVSNKEKVFWVDFETGDTLGIFFDECSVPKVTKEGFFISGKIDDEYMWVDLIKRKIIYGKYEIVGELDSLDDILVFPAYDKKEKKWFYVDVAKEEMIGKKFDILQLPRRTYGHWFYKAMNDGIWYIVDNVEGNTRGDGYDKIFDFMNSGDHWLLHVENDSDTFWVNNTPDSTMNRTFKYVEHPIEVNDRYFFLSYDPDEENVEYIDLYTNESVTPKFKEASTIYGHNDMALVSARVNKKWFLYDLISQKQITPEFTYIGVGLFKYKDMSLLRVKRDNNLFVWFDIVTGKAIEEWGEYSDICCMSEENNVFFVNRYGNKFWYDFVEKKQYEDKEKTKLITK